MARTKKKGYNGSNEEEAKNKNERFGGGCGLRDLWKIKTGGMKNKATSNTIAQSRQMDVRSRDNTYELDFQPRVICLQPVTRESQKQNLLRDKRASRRDTPFILAETTDPLFTEEIDSKAEASGKTQSSAEVASSGHVDKAEKQMENTVTNTVAHEIEAPPIPDRSPNQPKPYKSINGNVRRLASSIQTYASVAVTNTNPDTIRQASREVREAAETRDMEDLFGGNIHQGVTEKEIEEILASVSKY